MAGPTTSPRPRARPTTSAPTTSPRPQARPTSTTGGHREREAARQASRRSERDSGSNTPRPVEPVAPPPPPRQEAREADRGALDNLLRERSMQGGSYRSTVLTSLYGIADDGKRATRSLQSFNGRTGGATVLGR